MERVHFISFRNVVLKTYRGNANEAKKTLAAELRDAKLTGAAFADFIELVKIYTQQSADLEGSKFDWTGGDFNLDESFAAGKGSATKAAACHFYFLCHKNYATRAKSLNKAIDLPKLMGKKLETLDFGFASSSSSMKDEQVRSILPRPTAPFEWPPYISKEIAFSEDAQ